MIRNTELAGLCQTIARDTGLDVTVGGERSHISPDGKRLNIAAMPMTPEGRLVAVGLAWHEVGHKLYTDMTGGPGPGLLGDLVNVIEDVREERDFIADRPGAAYDLDAVTTYYVSRGHLMPDDTTSAVIALTMGSGRSLLLGQTIMEPAMEKAREILEENLGGAFLALIEGILKGYLSMPRGKTGTASSREMAQRIVSLLEEQIEDPPPVPPEPTPETEATESEEDEEQGGGSSDNQENQQDTEDDSSSGNQNLGTDDGDEEPSTLSEQDNQSADSSPPGNNGKKADPEQIRNMIAEGAGDFGDLQKIAIEELDHMSQQVSPEVRRMLPQYPRVNRQKPDESGLVDESRCIAATSRMRARLMGLLQAVKRLPERFGTSGRKLAVNRLVKMSTGDPRIFRKRVEAIAVNTAVVILLDRSGSMDGDKITTARNAAFSLHHTLMGVSGVKVHSVGFDLQDEDQSPPPIQVLCNWGDKPRPECFGLTPGYCTPTPWALWYAWVELLFRPEPRKIVLLVTDGRPEGWDGIEEDTRAATARLNRDGIEIAAIGIFDETVREYWKNNRVIQNLDELPEAMFGVMTDLLTRKQ